MARKAIKTWEDVDKALKEITECTNEIEVIETGLSVKINDAQDKATQLATPLKEKIALLEKQIQEFTERHKNDLDGKSKKLNFGLVGFRQSARTELVGKVEEVISALKKFKMTDCIELKETVNKNILKKYSDQELEKVGAKRITEENFFFKIVKGKVQD